MTTLADVTTKPWTDEVVLVHDLRVDRSYQREPHPTLVNAIARAWDMALAGYITVNRRDDGSLYIVDGQQRMNGARKAGEDEMLARVFDGLTVEEEAQLFSVLNNAKPLSAQDKFKGAYAAGRPDVVAIHAIVHSYGARIAGVDGRGDAIIAVGALQTIYNSGGERGLSKTLTVIRRALGEITRYTTQGAFMIGVFMIVDRNGLDEKRLAKKIRDKGLTAIKQMAIARGNRSADAASYYVVLLDVYGHGLPAHKKPVPVWRRTDTAPPDEEDE